MTANFGWLEDRMTDSSPDEETIQEGLLDVQIVRASEPRNPLANGSTIRIGDAYSVSFRTQATPLFLYGVKMKSINSDPGVASEAELFQGE